MFMKDIVNDLYNKCLYSSTNGYKYDPVFFGDIAFDRYLLATNKERIMTVKEQIDKIEPYKDKPIYQNEVGDSLEKIDALINALEKVTNVDLDDSELAKRYNVSENINKLLSLFGVKIRFYENKDRFVDVIKDDRVIVKGLVTKIGESLIIDFKVEDKNYQVSCYLSNDVTSMVKIQEDNKNDDTRSIMSTNNQTFISVSSTDEKNNKIDFSRIAAENDDNTVEVENSITEKDSNKTTSSSLVHIEDENYVIKRDTSLLSNSSRVEKSISLAGRTLFLNGMKRGIISEEEVKEIHNELVSHDIIRKPIIETLDILDKSFPGIEDYLLKKHKFIGRELDKDYPAGEFVSSIIDHLYGEFYNNNNDSSKSY